MSRPWWVPPAVLVTGAALATQVPTWGWWTAGGLAVVCARPAWRRWRLWRHYTQPVTATLRLSTGDAPTYLYLSRATREHLYSRLAHRPGRIEARVRGWYGRRIEPVLRWLPDRAMRGWWWTQAAAVRAGLAPESQPENTTPAIRLRLSVPYVTPEQRAFISAVVGGKLPVDDVAERWNLVGRHCDASWTVRRRPPTRVGLAELEAAYPRLGDEEFYLGQSAAAAVTISLADDSPHIAISAGSGAGKSVLAQLVAAQVLARGGRVILLDFKGSHRWALDMDGVDYCTEPAQQHTALIRAAELAKQRNAIGLHAPDGWDPGPRVLVIAEELNASIALLRDHWAEVREKSDPKISPAITALRYISYTGRSAKVHLMAVAQMLSAQASGGPEARENFGIRCLSRYTANAWKMLTPEISMPRASRVRGRWQICVAGEATETQVAFLDRAEVRMFIARQRSVAGVPMSQDTLDQGNGPDVLGQEPSVTLAEACRSGLVPWSLAATRKRLQRSENAPESAGTVGSALTYRPADLTTWVDLERARKS